MKIVKRDGRIVEYDSNKIKVAISKANSEVDDDERATTSEIEDIIKYIEKSKKKRMLVEDIQDIIEEKLMSFGKYALAKEYIIYRYTRALVRKSNTTDETILSLIKGNNIGKLNGEGKKYIVSMQRDLIAGEVSKDLTLRMLLPDKISEAHENGVIFFHNMEYFLQPVINSSVINIEDMLENGTVVADTKMYSPNSFRVACTIMGQIISSVINSQCGGVTLDISCLGKYLRKSYKRLETKYKEKYTSKIAKDELEAILCDMLNNELKDGIQTLNYQINTQDTINGKEPKVMFILNLKDDEYINENEKIIKEMLNQRIYGMRDERDNFKNIKIPKLVYLLNETNTKGKYLGLTKYAMECTMKTGNPSYISTLKSMEVLNSIVYPMEDRHFLNVYKKEKHVQVGRFNQGIVSINLARTALDAKESEKDILELLEERLDLCFEALMCRHHALLGTVAGVSPIHFRYGGIKRLDEQEKIDSLLKDGYSTLTLGYVGLTELLQIAEEDIERKNTLKLKVLKKLKDTCDKWTKETGLSFELYATEDDEPNRYFEKKDLEKFGVIKKVTDKNKYETSMKVVTEDELLNVLQQNSKFEKYVIGTSVDIQEFMMNNNFQEKLIDYIYNNNIYVEFRKEIK